MDREREREFDLFSRIPEAKEVDIPRLRTGGW